VSLTPADHAELERIARATLREHQRTGTRVPGRPHKPTLLAPATVTARLFVGETLRAEATATGVLYAAAQDAVIAAAGELRDPDLRIELIVVA